VPISYKWPFPFMFMFSHHVSTMCATCPAHLILLDLAITTFGTVMKFIMQLSPSSYYLLPPRSKYSPQHSVLKRPSLIVTDQVLISTLVDSTRKWKRLWTNLVASTPQTQSVLNLSVNGIWIHQTFPRHLDMILSNQNWIYDSSQVHWLLSINYMTIITLT
jgi:hypothetical protein